MTIKALIHKLHEASAHHHVDRFHGGGHYEHGHSWHGSKGKGSGNSGAALSALTLLAFLFFLNVIQQSLLENNGTETTTATTIFLRDDKQPISLTARVDDEHTIENKAIDTSTLKSEPKKEKIQNKIIKPPN